MEGKEKRLRLVRFWLVGTFLIVWAAVTTYIGIFTGDPMAAIVAGLPMWAIVGAAAVILYFLYKAWLSRQPG